MRPEHALLLKAGSDQLASLPEGLDWSQVVQLAEQHRLTPALWVRLQSLGLDDVPADVQEQLSKLTAEHTIRSTLWGKELAWALNALSRAGVETLIWKGPELQSRIDPEVPRMYRDLDIVVHLEDAGKAAEALAERYTPPGKGAPAFERGAKDIQFKHKESPLTLELHASFIEPLGMVERLDQKAWQSSRSIDWQGATTSRLDPQLEFLMLCWHGARHAFFRLRWLAELALLLRSEDLKRTSEVLYAAEGSVGIRSVALAITLLDRAGLLENREWSLAVDASDASGWADKWAKRLLESPLDVGTKEERNRRRWLEFQVLPPEASSLEWLMHLTLDVMRRGPG